MPKYELMEQGYVFDTVEADDAESALDDQSPNYADYSGDGDEQGTVFVEWYARNVDDRDDYASRSYTLSPPEPVCPSANAHDWQSPVELVGGISENPGVWGHGGGVTISECCMCCGMRKLTDTWAQNPTDGTEGHETVSYSEPGYYTLPESEES